MNDTIPFEIEIKVPENVDVKDVSVQVDKTKEVKAEDKPMDTASGNFTEQKS